MPMIPKQLYSAWGAVPKVPGAWVAPRCLESLYYVIYTHACAHHKTSETRCALAEDADPASTTMKIA
jgi:hypothetical protein